jgi:single-stranded-DNA-specific exonuclease
VVCHSDADGFCSGVILLRALHGVGRNAGAMITGKGEHPWAPEMNKRIRAAGYGALIIADLSSRDRPIVEHTPSIFIDHHAPHGVAPGAILVSGHGRDPEPASGLLALWCCSGVADVSGLEWLAAVSLIGDMADAAAFPEYTRAAQLFGEPRLREVTSLLNAARRCGSQARTAFDLLLRSETPAAFLAQSAPLVRVRERVRREIGKARRAAPRFKDDVALLVVDSDCQVHPVVAQAWRNRLKNHVVLCANTGYRPGYVHFSARSARPLDLISFLRGYAPAGSGDDFASGHPGASGGVLTEAQWREFLVRLGFKHQEVG